jgi:hypothetical protein
MKNSAFEVSNIAFEDLAHAKDENGVFYGHYCTPYGYCRKQGEYSAADDMTTTVNDFAAFLLAVMSDDWVSKQLVNERSRVQSIKPAQERFVNCEEQSKVECPTNQGFGLGWEVLDYGDRKILSHGGSDWAEMTLVYYYSDTNDGYILFFNAPNSNGVSAMLNSLKALDPDSPLIGGYQRWHDYLQSN